jgi:hypothetical protein
MSSDAARKVATPGIQVEVLECGSPATPGWKTLVLGRDVKFSTARLVSYAYARWEPLIFDAMVLAAAVEYGDKMVERPSSGWTRQVTLRIPVHNVEVWSSPTVAVALQDALEFLTGDRWIFEFVTRSAPADPPSQECLEFPIETEAVLPFSDGMDSRSVAGILSKAYGQKLVRVRIGSKSWDRKLRRKLGKARPEPFTTVPYELPIRTKHREASGRTRGFKFALISCIAAYLADAEEIVVPESGQGALGPALLNVGHAYPDYRNHPLFLKRMEIFNKHLFGTEVKFIFPRIWSTKGETLREFIAECEGADWESTRSCWRSNVWASVNGKTRQCGICAACMLRRVSVHAAGLTEKPDTYIVTNMGARTMEEAVQKDFKKLTKAFKEYAIAGVLHMDDLAEMAEADAIPDLKRHATLLAPALNLSSEDTASRLKSLFSRHAEEWRSYLESLGEHSFVKQWVRAGL